MTESHPPLELGRREKVALPLLGIKKIMARVDTGAAYSTLHALDIVKFKRQGKRWVRFYTQIARKKNAPLRLVEAPIHTTRKIKSSNGQETERLVIVTDIIIGQWRWPVLVTLADRTEMTYRMLLGRQSMGSWCHVLPHILRIQPDPDLATTKWRSEDLFKGEMTD